MELWWSVFPCHPPDPITKKGVLVLSETVGCLREVVWIQTRPCIGIQMPEKKGKNLAQLLKTLATIPGLTKPLKTLSVGGRFGLRFALMIDKCRIICFLCMSARTTIGKPYFESKHLSGWMMVVIQKEGTQIQNQWFFFSLANAKTTSWIISGKYSEKPIRLLAVHTIWIIFPETRSTITIFEEKKFWNYVRISIICGLQFLPPKTKQNADFSHLSGQLVLSSKYLSTYKLFSSSKALNPWREKQNL